MVNTVLTVKYYTLESDVQISLFAYFYPHIFHRLPGMLKDFLPCLLKCRSLILSTVH